MTLDERSRPATLEAVWRAFGGNFKLADFEPGYRLPEDLLRTSDYLTHPIFHMNRAESEMTRYIRRLSDRDLALDRAMIPLGSCTMKLNATAEMLPITWPEFSDIHPFVPEDQALGYREMIDDLTDKLCAVTGYDAFSMQPNSGAQGEYAGLLDHPQLPYRQRRRSARRLPDPDLRARDQPGLGADGRHEGGRGQGSRQRRHRPRRFPRQGGSSMRTISPAA